MKLVQCTKWNCPGVCPRRGLSSEGSVLGLILSTMFVSDVPGIMNNLTSMFADDTKLYATLTDDNNSPHSLQEDLTKLQEWSMKMQMNFHPDKCCVLYLGQSNPQNIYHMRARVV